MSPQNETIGIPLSGSLIIKNTILHVYTCTLHTYWHGFFHRRLLKLKCNDGSMQTSERFFFNADVTYKHVHSAFCDQTLVTLNTTKQSDNGISVHAGRFYWCLSRTSDRIGCTVISLWFIAVLSSYVLEIIRNVVVFPVFFLTVSANECRRFALDL